MNSLPGDNAAAEPDDLCELGDESVEELRARMDRLVRTDYDPHDTAGDCGFLAVAREDRMPESARWADICEPQHCQTTEQFYEAELRKDGIPADERRELERLLEYYQREAAYWLRRYNWRSQANHAHQWEGADRLAELERLLAQGDALTPLSKQALKDEIILMKQKGNNAC